MEIVLCFIGLFILRWIFTLIDDSKAQAKERRKKEHEEFVKRNYPNAYAKYWGVAPKRIGFYTPVDNRVYENYTIAEWKAFEYVIKNEIIEKQRNEIEMKWEEDQYKFSFNSYKKSKDIMPNFGRYNYEIRISLQNLYSPSLNIWQHFPFSACLETDLDYTYNKVIKQNTDNLLFQSINGLVVDNNYLNSIFKFLQNLSMGKRLMVLFNSKDLNWSADALNKTYNVITKEESTLMLRYCCNKCFFGDLYSDNISDIVKNNLNSSVDIIVIIDACTTNDQLRKNCEYILTQLHEWHPMLTYISLIKCYDREEMSAIIKESKEQAMKLEEEKRLREAEEAKRKVEELQIQRKREEERVIHRNAVKDEIINNAKNWSRLIGGLYYTWLFDYYPTTCEFEATDDEWDNRWRVWNFKNDPEKGIKKNEHKAALKELIPKIEQRLINTFGKENLQTITLFCIPASTKEKNDARYKDFSYRICKDTDMENGYEHTYLIKDGLSKKDPNNHTGQSIQPVIEYDKEFFRDKLVLLFDDVVTKGDSMNHYRKTMESLGATVIGGICLGKTTHTRPF